MERSQNQHKPKRPIGAGTIITLAVLTGFLVLAGVFFAQGWETPDGPKGTEISVNG